MRRVARESPAAQIDAPILGDLPAIGHSISHKKIRRSHVDKWERGREFVEWSGDWSIASVGMGKAFGRMGNWVPGVGVLRSNVA